MFIDEQYRGRRDWRFFVRCIHTSDGVPWPRHKARTKRRRGVKCRNNLLGGRCLVTSPVHSFIIARVRRRRDRRPGRWSFINNRAWNSIVLYRIFVGHVLLLGRPPRLDDGHFGSTNFPVCRRRALLLFPHRHPMYDGKRGIFRRATRAYDVSRARTSFSPATR